MKENRDRNMADFAFDARIVDVAALEADLAQTIVAALKLEMSAAEIDPEAPLFVDGLGLDSIDALEIAVSVSERYRVQLRSDDPNNKRIFASLRSLAEHIAAHLPRSADMAGSA
jgi:acyl carrier protein